MQCVRKDCESTDVQFPIFKFWASGHSKEEHDPILAKLDTPVCPAHRQEFEQDSKDNLVKELNKVNKRLGKAEVDPFTAECEWNDLEDAQ